MTQEAPQDTIYIRAAAKRNGLTAMLTGGVALIIAILLFRLLPQEASLVGIFVTSLAIVAFLIGWFKVREPAHSMELNRTHLCYHHRKGSWQLDWDNIQRIDIPKITRGVEQTPLALVGIRLKDYRPLLSSISPRLATHMMMEQRPLLLQSPGENCDAGTCYSDDLIEEDKYRDAEGTLYQGIMAMYANRMTKLRERLGYDIFINSAELDRDQQEFVTLLRDCQLSALTQDQVDRTK